MGIAVRLGLLVLRAQQVQKDHMVPLAKQAFRDHLVKQDLKENMEPQGLPVPTEILVLKALQGIVDLMEKLVPSDLPALKVPLVQLVRLAQKVTLGMKEQLVQQGQLEITEPQERMVKEEKMVNMVLTVLMVPPDQSVIPGMVVPMETLAL